MAGIIDTTEQKIHDWRVETFVGLGFHRDDAELLAIARDERTGWLIDIHRIRTLVRAGCSPELAMRILL